MNLDTSLPIASVHYNDVEMELGVDLTPVLLWENADPTSTFAAQDVTVSGDDYSAYLVEGKGYYNADLTTGITMIPKDGTAKAMCALKVNGTAISVRYVSADGNTISFGKGGTVTPGTSQASANQNCIPTRIWGVNFTLD